MDFEDYDLIPVELDLSKFGGNGRIYGHMIDHNS
jgi:hypothetical protein